MEFHYEVCGLAHVLRSTAAAFYDGVFSTRTVFDQKSIKSELPRDSTGWFSMHSGPVFFYCLDSNFLKIRSEKNVTLILISAFLIAYLGASDFLPSVGIDIFNIEPLGFIPIALWIFLVGYTVLHYRIWNVRFVASQTIYYGFISAIILITYSFLFWAFFRIVEGEVNQTILAFNTILLIKLKILIENSNLDLRFHRKINDFTLFHLVTRSGSRRKLKFSKKSNPCLSVLIPTLMD